MEPSWASMTQDFRIHYKINSTFALDMSCNPCSRKQGTGVCNHALAAPPAGTTFFKTDWSYSALDRMRVTALHSASSVLHMPARSSWKTPAPSREDITPVGGHCSISPPKIPGASKPTTDFTTRCCGQNTWLHFTRDVDRWESA